MTFIIVLIALVSLALASVALIRSIDTGTLLMGNLAFKEAATSSADSAVETAMAWLSGKLSAPTDLYESRCSIGCTVQDNQTAYYPTSLDALDISGHSATVNRALVDWEDNGCNYASSGTFAVCLKASVGVKSNGYKTQYVIARMCKASGDPNASANNCALPIAGGTGSGQINKGETKYGAITALKVPGSGAGTGGSTLMYRIIVRSAGPRNTVSYTETYVGAVAS